MPRQFQAPEIVHHRHCAPAEHFDALFREASITIGDVNYGALRAVSESNRHHDIVSPIAAVVFYGLRIYLYRQGARQKAQEIHKVTNLADNASAPLLWIVNPIVRLDVSGID